MIAANKRVTTVNPPAGTEPTAAQDFAAGFAAALNPTTAGGGPLVTTLACPRTGLVCSVCQHTFRVGDRVVVGAGGLALHDGGGLMCTQTVP